MLFYLCGHFTPVDEALVSAIEEFGRIELPAHLAVCAFVDLPDGAYRAAFRYGESAETTSLGAVNSGDPATLDQFITWALDACRARYYVLVIGGRSSVDPAPDSVVSGPPIANDVTRFALGHDDATADAIMLNELAATLEHAFAPPRPHQLVLLATDASAMQFIEVAYELRAAVEFLVGSQPIRLPAAPPRRRWPYPQLLQRWKNTLSAAAESGTLAQSHTVGLALGRDTVMTASDFDAPDRDSIATVSVIDLKALTPLIDAFDTFCLVYLQWFGHDVFWQARERVVRSSIDALPDTSSYDLHALMISIAEELRAASRDAVPAWANRRLRHLPPSVALSVARGLTAAARQRADRLPANDERAQSLQRAAAACDMWRSEIESRSGRRVAPRIDFEGSEWNDVFRSALPGFPPAVETELGDMIEGTRAAIEVSRLAERVSQLIAEDAIVAARTPLGGSGQGLSIFRPSDLSTLADSDYLEMRWGREQHWTALLTLVEVINQYPRLLWRLVESQLSGGVIEARFQMMRRLSGEQVLAGRQAERFRAIYAPDTLTLAFEPISQTPTSGDANDDVQAFSVRLGSLNRSERSLERRNRTRRSVIAGVVARLAAMASGATPRGDQSALIERAGAVLGDDLLDGIAEHVPSEPGDDGRPRHLILQVPPREMSYPWELLRLHDAPLMERFAVGRKSSAVEATVPVWSTEGRSGLLRLLVVAPTITYGTEHTGTSLLEAQEIASLFAVAHQRIPGLVEPLDYSRFVGQSLTVEAFRTLLREGRYDVVHFAGSARYDPEHEERSCWLFSDGPLYAFELRHTMANAAVAPWLIYGSANAEPDGAYHNGVYGIARAALDQGAAACIAPLWRVSDTDARNFAAAFYDELLLRRVTIGEAVTLARQSVKARITLADLTVESDASVTNGHRPPDRSAGWASFVLYGDPTATITHRLGPSPARTPLAEPASRSIGTLGSPDTR